MWVPFLCTKTRLFPSVYQHYHLNRKVCGRMLVVPAWSHLMCKLNEYNTYVLCFSMNLVPGDCIFRFWGSFRESIQVQGRNIFMASSLSSPVYPAGWTTVSCWLSATACSVYLHLPAVFGDCLPSPIWGRAVPQWQETYLAFINIIIIIIIILLYIQW
jgi:hypothetical protein